MQVFLKSLVKTNSPSKDPRVNELIYGRPSEDSGTVVGCNSNSSVSDVSGSDLDAPSYGVIQRRLRKAIKANTKWQQKYEIETWASHTCLMLCFLLLAGKRFRVSKRRRGLGGST